MLDVGTGSGILAIWSAKAGARKVYAVEATDMAAHARTLVAGNNVENVVEVIEGSIEDITLPEQGAQRMSKMVNQCLCFYTSYEFMDTGIVG